MSKVRRSPWLITALLAGVAAVFYLIRLDNWALWQDEANAALLSRNILRFGVPAVFDGVNVIWPSPSDVSPGRHVWILWGWLPLYVGAAFFKILGVSTLAARLPGALLGVIAVPTFYVALKRLPLAKGTAEWASLLVVFSVPLALVVRQCGYYGYALVFSFLMFYQYHLAAPSRGRTRFFLLGSLGLVNTHMLIWGAVLGGLAASDVARPARLKQNAGLLLAAVGSAVPFLALYEAWTLLDRSLLSAKGPAFPLGQRLRFYVRALHECLLPWPYLVTLGLAGFFARREIPEETKSLLVRGACFVAAGLVLTAVATGFMFLRYVLFVVPVLFLLVAVLQAHVYEWNRPLGVVSLVLLCLFGMWGMSLSPRRHSFLTQFLGELSRDGTDINEELAAHLNRHASPGDVVLCNYEEFPLQFYTPFVIRGGMGQIGLGRNPADEVFDIPRVEKPDWIVRRKHWDIFGGDAIGAILEKHPYLPVPIHVADTPFGNREDPYYHFFSTPPVQSPFILYRLAESAPRGGG